MFIQEPQRIFLPITFNLSSETIKQLHCFWGFWLKTYSQTKQMLSDYFGLFQEVVRLFALEN